MATLPDLLKTTKELGGSDLHIALDTPPQVEHSSLWWGQQGVAAHLSVPQPRSQEPQGHWSQSRARCSLVWRGPYPYPPPPGQS